ncbi:MAG: hypothetical protein L0H84_08425 [Pseudonocardia sp.]|nr:hypothetical protein [Pseudonocardia sp.]
MVAQPGTLSLQDIADLARVSRPVVSMWRRRPQIDGKLVPFPKPVRTTERTERFDRDEVVAYLETTGRGNNVDTRLDAPAVAVPDTVDLEDAITFLCLHALTGAELDEHTAAELADLAEQTDPHDSLLLREVKATAGDPHLLRYVDDLVEASYGTPDALARLERGRLRREAAERGLNDELVDLLCSVTTAARLYLTDDAVALVPPADHRMTRRLAEGFAGIVLADDPAARARRRRAVIDGIEVLDGAPALVRVLSVVGLPDADALRAADDLVLELRPTDVGVVLGAASLLCDPLVGDLQQSRSATLRPGNLALAARLPRGLWKGAHRQSLAVWVLRGAGAAGPVWLADLDAEEIVPDDLASDVLAALQHTEHRSYRYARRAELATVLAAGAVVPRGVRAVRLAGAETSTYLDRIHAATLTTSAPVPGYDGTVAAAPGQIVLRRRSLGELREAGRLAVRRGIRIDRSLDDAGGSVRALSADGSTDAVRLDPFDVAQRYPRAVRTEPGDVVFLQRPRPVARVDPDGGALVAAPSRILRLRPGGPVGPHTLAAIVNVIVPDGSEWPTWSVPDLPPGEAAALDAVLAAAAARKAELSRHERALQDLVTNLVHGVAAGAVTIDPTITTLGAR